MTIINSFVQGNRAYLLTDMAWIDYRDGRVLACDSKFLRGVNFPWAIAVTGDAYLEPLLAQLNWLQPGNAMQMAEALPKAMNAVRVLCGDPTFTMAIRLAAWCRQTRRPRVFHIDSDADRAAAFGIEPWEVVEPVVLIPGDGIADWLPDVSCEPQAVMDPRQFDPRRDGVRIVAAQREHVRFPRKGGTEPMALIGCGVQLASVGKRGVTIETLHTWEEDRVGEFIAPRSEACPA